MNGGKSQEPPSPSSPTKQPPLSTDGLSKKSKASLQKATTAKDEGDKLFKQKNQQEAIDKYSEALTLLEEDGLLG